MEECKARGESVYVHCKAGKGRSATAVVCYLIKVGCSVVQYAVHVCSVGGHTFCILALFMNYVPHSINCAIHSIIY